MFLLNVLSSDGHDASLSTRLFSTFEAARDAAHEALSLDPGPFDGEAQDAGLEDYAVWRSADGAERLEARSEDSSVWVLPLPAVESGVREY